MKNCIDCNIELKHPRSIRCRSCAKKGKLNPSYGQTFIRSDEFKEAVKIRQTGESNSSWKGDSVGYLGIHAWVNNHKEKPEVCEICHEKKRLDLANISQEYKRDLDDWEYLCRKCHMTKDGRIEQLKLTQFKPHGA